MKLRLVIEVEYDPGNTSEQELRQLLEHNACRAVDMDLLLSGVNAEITHLDIRVDEPIETTYEMLYPERRYVIEQQLLIWAGDAIANGLSDLFTSPGEVQTVADAIRVLHDAGTVTIRNKT